MSRYEWEKGEFIIPSAEWASFKAAIRDAVNKQNAAMFEAARQLHAYVTLNSKTRPSHMDLRDVAWKGVDQISKGGYHGTRFTGTEQGVIVDSVISEKWPNGYHQRSVLKLKKPLKKDFPQHGNNVNSFRSGECEVSFDNATRKVFWNVSENNHAVDDARESALGKALFARLGKVAWTRGTGGSVYGNDEYNQDAGRYGAGGGASYTKERFGPDVPKPAPTRDPWGGRPFRRF